MFIDEGASDEQLAQQKTLKISLPARLHLKLHSLKILHGVTISETVETALLSYLDGDDGGDEVPPASETSGQTDADAVA